MRHRFQVCRIDTAANTTEMVQLETVGDGTNKCLIDRTVSGLRSPTTITNRVDEAVPVVVHIARPGPALVIGVREEEPEQPPAGGHRVKVNLSSLCHVVTSR